MSTNKNGKEGGELKLDRTGKAATDLFFQGFCC